MKTNPNEFVKFHEFVKDHNPYYIVASPCSKICRTRKQVSFKTALSMMERNYNIAILSNPNSPLIFIDVDYPMKMTSYKDTLKCISGSGRGFHLIYTTNDPKCKVSYNGDAGELQADGKYIIVPGSRIKKGSYFLSEPREPTEISFETLPEVYQRPPEERGNTTTPQKNSPLSGLKMEDIFSYTEGRSFPSPFHGSDAGHNTQIKGGLLHCYRCGVYHTPKTALAVLAGMINCSDGFRHRGDKTLNKEINETELFVWAIANNYIKMED